MDEFIEKIKIANIFNAFRDSLLSKLDPEPGKLVMHVIPLESLDPMKQIEIKNPVSTDLLRPMGRRGNPRYNADGWRCGSDDSYLQLYRNGIIESVKTFGLYDERGAISGRDIDTELVKCLGSCLAAEKSLGIEPHFLILVSMIGVKGYMLYSDAPGCYYNRESEIGLDKVTIAPIEIKDYETTDVGFILRPALDALWQAADFVGSPFYDTNGNRTI